MSIYTIDICAIGSYCVIDFNDRSGCSDVEVDCWQEALFYVAAGSIDEAARLIYREYEKLNEWWTNSCDTLYYDPKTVEIEDDDSDDPAEIVAYYFKEPRDGDGTKEGPRRYSKEVEL